MFGHQNNNDQPNAGHVAPTADDALGTTEPETISPTSAASAPPVDDNVSNDYVLTDLPTVVVTEAPSEADEPVASTPFITAPVIAESVAAPATVPASQQPAAAATDLLELKQAALQELSPLVGHLEQTPEEKFRTTMMMIQAADDQTMLQTAYDAAKQITDEKVRAQALLDVINEINYFTQHHSD